MFHLSYQIVTKVSFEEDILMQETSTIVHGTVETVVLLVVMSLVDTLFCTIVICEGRLIVVVCFVIIVIIRLLMLGVGGSTSK